VALRHWELTTTSARGRELTVHDHFKGSKTTSSKLRYLNSLEPTSRISTLEIVHTIFVLTAWIMDAKMKMYPEIWRVTVSQAYGRQRSSWCQRRIAFDSLFQKIAAFTCLESADDPNILRITLKLHAAVSVPIPQLQVSVKLTVGF
jgi:hypothetical protein